MGTDCDLGEANRRLTVQAMVFEEGVVRTSRSGRVYKVAINEGIRVETNFTESLNFGQGHVGLDRDRNGVGAVGTGPGIELAHVDAGQRVVVEVVAEGHIGRNERHDQGQDQSRDEHANLHVFPFQ